MSPLAYLLFLVLLVLPVAWLVSEFRGTRPLRIGLGILSIVVVSFCIGALITMFTYFNYNASYGHVTGELIKTSIHQIEDGQLDRVLKVWRGLDRQYHPTYENRAQYVELAEEATRRIRGEEPIELGSSWDASTFDAKTWNGHWENDTGYWIVINSWDQTWDVVRSGDPTTKMQSVSVSPDYGVIKFKEDNQWFHTITLKNKYEATHEWIDGGKGTVWKTNTLHKLIRASEEQKRTTQQAEPVKENKE